MAKTLSLKQILSGIKDGSITSWKDPVFDNYRNSNTPEMNVIKKALEAGKKVEKLKEAIYNKLYK